MPPAFVPLEGAMYLNKSLLRDPSVAADDWILRTFGNTFTPTRDSVYADFTESVFSGYVAKILDPSGWLAPVNNNYVVLSYRSGAPELFNISSGSATIYGWYITRENTTVLWCQKLDTPYTITPTLPYAILPIWAGQSFFQPV